MGRRRPGCHRVFSFQQRVFPRRCGKEKVIKTFHKNVHSRRGKIPPPFSAPLSGFGGFSTVLTPPTTTTKIVIVNKAISLKKAAAKTPKKTKPPLPCCLLYKIKRAAFCLYILCINILYMILYYGFILAQKCAILFWIMGYFRNSKIKGKKPFFRNNVGATTGRPPTWRRFAFFGVVFSQGKQERASIARPYLRGNFKALLLVLMDW